MSIGHNSGLALVDARRWTQLLNKYRTPSHARSIAELLITVLPLVALWAAAWFAFSLGHAWASMLIAVPAAGFLVRLFMIQHDCGHGAFFAHRQANNWVGRIISVLTLTPYDFWRRAHAVHHATAGNLDRRGIGDVDTLTVREYRACSRWGRLKYRLYRHPLVMFGVGSACLFFVQHRLPIGLMRQRLATLGQHHGNQFRDSIVRRRADVAHRTQGLSARASSDHAACRHGRRLAVLCATPVRAHGVGARWRVEPA